MRRPAFILLALVTSIVAAACGRGAAPPEREAPTRLTEAPAAATRPSRPAGTPRIVFLGDSLTAGLGLPENESYPSLIQARLDREGYAYEVVNAGVSGDTSAGGLRRLDWSLDGNVKVLLLALGGNDGLRGLPTAELKRNLATIIETATARGVQVVLAGMEAPPNNGQEYAAAFRAIYRDLAQQYRVPLIPFLLLGVAGDTALNQADGIHPNTRGAEIVAELIWRALTPVLSEPAAAPGAAKGEAKE